MASLPPLQSSPLPLGTKKTSPLSQRNNCFAVHSPHKKSRCFASTSFIFCLLTFSTLKNNANRIQLSFNVLIILHFTTIKNESSLIEHLLSVLIILCFTTLKNTFDFPTYLHWVLIIPNFSTLKNSTSSSLSSFKF